MRGTDLDQDDRETELKKLKLKLLLFKNQYPMYVIETQMKTCQKDQPDQRMKRFFTLPFTIKKCEEFATLLLD